MLMSYLPAEMVGVDLLLNGQLLEHFCDIESNDMRRLYCGRHKGGP
jgi:hypothetical protein